VLRQLVEFDALVAEAVQGMRWSTLTPVFVLASAFWVKWPLFLAVGAGADLRRRSRTAALTAGAAVAGAAALVTVIKDLVDRVRPALAEPSVTAIGQIPESASFPSGHSATAFAAATALGVLCPKLRWPLLALASLVAFSRVYLGVHYALDVLVGTALGVAVGLSVATLVKRRTA
jgi:undecaprenyl-diphosphatase